MEILAIIAIIAVAIGGYFYLRSRGNEWGNDAPRQGGKGSRENRK